MITELRRMVDCTGCGRRLVPRQWGQPGDCAWVDPVAAVVLGVACGCAARAEEKVAEAAERRGRV